MHGYYRARVEHLFAHLWSWRVVRDICTRILLHFSQFMLRRQKSHQPYGPWEHIPSSIWTEEEAPEVDEEEEDTPPPPASKNHLAQEPTLGSAVKFSHHFFYQGSGFFMFLVDVGQLFRCAGHHFMCVTTGPPIRGDPMSHSQAHIPLKPLLPALDPFPEATSP